MAFAGALGSELGLRLLLSPAGTNIVVRTASVGIGIGFPVYSTFKAIERKNQAEQEEWLVYWTVYGCFTVAEIFSDSLLSWCPFYYHAKLVFLVWLQFPHNYGARHVFKVFLKPLFVKHKPQLDRIVEGTRSDLDTFVKTTKERKEVQAIVHTTKNLALSAYHSLGDLIKGHNDNSIRGNDEDQTDQTWVHVRRDEDQDE
ncbi:hypothetical protein SELMODRAFT_451332 [Selaginella moellendorffii]|uniref:HVA22-like protein n=1 Tax=Selaginella moellendorffii TaxID=88036 RepID=D8REP1_SELML|nr:HVA22-like protein k [Selaginella moellendorffii]EFJ29474.1 hypothetical protein SELMODRAFT_451332 [Selaginella moellendorffii]|eukprot:XP_002969386.1 HVA22-like protein k [Selaginella moellendorffii]